MIAEKKFAVFVGIQFAILAAFAIPANAMAQERSELDSLIQVVRRLEFELARVTNLAEMSEVDASQAPVPDQRLRTTSGVGARPFVYNRGGTAVGGYVDIEFVANLDSDQSTFRQHRLIPFIFSEVTDRIHFGLELEFEDGGPNSPNDDGEVKVEFAALDIAVARGLNFRAGAILTPLGKFNLTHDSPVNDLTDRPLVDRLVIPTTLTEAGAGFFGTLYPNEQSVVTYEAYIVNGFDNELIRYAATVAPGDTSVTSALDIRSARGSLKRDNNGARSFAGRIGFSPVLGVEIGVSGHFGRYGDDGSGRLSILALDGIVQRGRFELLGELARSGVSVDATAERQRARAVFDDAADRAGVADAVRDVAFGNAFGATAFPNGQFGYVVQLNYHFGGDLIGAFPLSTFTGVVRWDRVDLDRSAVGDHLERLTVGGNLRLVEQTVLKIAYQWNWTTTRGATARGSADNLVVASVASYF